MYSKELKTLIITDFVEKYKSMKISVIRVPISVMKGTRITQIFIILNKTLTMQSTVNQ